MALARLRDRVAATLIAWRVTPNILTLAGVALTGGASLGLLFGAGHAPVWEAFLAPTTTSWWPLSVAAAFVLACACDFLDGAVARLGSMETHFGAVLDSTVDRISDLLIYFACAVHFALAGNATYVALSLAAAGNGVLISYVKARAERDVDDCSVGYWKRGERCVLFLVAACVGHIPAGLWLLGTVPALTVMRRLRRAGALLGTEFPLHPLAEGEAHLLWRQPRGSAGHMTCTALASAFVIFAPYGFSFFYGATDPLRALLGIPHA